MTKLLETMMQQIRQLSEDDQNKVAQNVIEQIKKYPQNKISNSSKLSDDLLMPILDAKDDDLFLRDRDPAREISL